MVVFASDSEGTAGLCREEFLKQAHAAKSSLASRRAARGDDLVSQEHRALLAVPTTFMAGEHADTAFRREDTAFRSCFHCLSSLRPCLSLWCCFLCSGPAAALDSFEPELAVAAFSPLLLTLAKAFQSCNLQKDAELLKQNMVRPHGQAGFLAKTVPFFIINTAFACRTAAGTRRDDQQERRVLQRHVSAECAAF